MSSSGEAALRYLAVVAVEGEGARGGGGGGGGGAGGEGEVQVDGVCSETQRRRRRDDDEDENVMNTTRKRGREARHVDAQKLADEVFRKMKGRRKRTET